MRSCYILAVILTSSALARGDDWPQWMGPKRDNVWREEGILEKFPKDGLKKVWSFPLAGGYSGPAVVGDRVYITDYVKKEGTTNEGNFERKPTSGTERVFCVDAKTGKEIWKHEYEVKYAISYPAGPRCTPTVDGDKVYTLGAEGNLICFDAAKGTVIWQKELKVEYKTKTALWGYAAHPLIDGNNLITLAGGEGSHVVALDKNTGKEVWKSQSAEEQGYVPPSIITAGGVRQLLIVAPTAIRALDPATGKRLWATDYTSDNGCVVMTPIVSGDYLYFGGYNNKNILLKLDKDKPGVTVEWKDKNKHGIAAVNTQPFLQDSIIYGFDDSGKMFAVDIPSGKRLWESTELVDGGAEKASASATAFIVKNGDRFFFFTEKGDLVIGNLTKEKYVEIDRTKVIEPTGKAWNRKVAWSMPAFAGKKMYVRNDKELICVDLAK